MIFTKRMSVNGKDSINLESLIEKVDDFANNGVAGNEEIISISYVLLQHTLCAVITLKKGG